MSLIRSSGQIMRHLSVGSMRRVAVSRPIVRNISQTTVRRGGHGLPGGVPGLNLPVDPNSGKYKITAIFVVVFGIAWGAPWFLIRWLLVRK